MTRDTKLYFDDIFKAIEEVEGFLKDLTFDDFCKDFFAEYLKGKGENVIRTGRWWGQVEVKPKKFEEREIDFIAETQSSMYFGECKWTNKKTCLADLDHLEESSRALKTKKTIKKVLFSKSGFEFNEANGITLFDPERITIEIGKLHESI